MSITQRECSKCGTIESSTWRYVNNLVHCNSCALREKKRALDPNLRKIRTASFFASLRPDSSIDKPSRFELNARKGATKRLQNQSKKQNSIDKEEIKKESNLRAPTIPQEKKTKISLDDIVSSSQQSIASSISIQHFSTQAEKNNSSPQPKKQENWDWLFLNEESEESDICQ